MKGVTRTGMTREEQIGVRVELLAKDRIKVMVMGKRREERLEIGESEEVRTRYGFTPGFERMVMKVTRSGMVPIIPMVSRPRE